MDFERLAKIASASLPGFPLVLHGASTVLPEFGEMQSIRRPNQRPRVCRRRWKAGTMGVCKINIDTDLRLAMTASIREHLATNPQDFDPRQYLKPAREAIKNMVKHKISNVLN